PRPPGPAPPGSRSRATRAREPADAPARRGRSVRALLGPQQRAGARELVPARRLEAVIDGLHRDAAGHRAPDLAQVAADALGLVDVGHPRAAVFARVDALVGAVVAGDHAGLAADARCGVD